MGLTIRAYTHADAWDGCADMIATIEGEARVLGIECETVDLAADPLVGESAGVSEIPTMLVHSKSSGRVLARKPGTANGEQVADYLGHLASIYRGTLFGLSSCAEQS